ncbi:uncharacterized protein LOC112904375 [Agrilus planipennis]|uniref:Uncharacterized protein LOC112904375 n=1 Tax=Agrilus planipennis TaxID=224129 RepID=A0A7F5R3Y4_AGRPL|nr:uncharacterized protein LOC112904375 [Agrilus planipennis]
MFRAGEEGENPHCDRDILSSLPGIVENGFTCSKLGKKERTPAATRYHSHHQQELLYLDVDLRLRSGVSVANYSGVFPERPDSNSEVFNTRNLGISRSWVLETSEFESRDLQN